MATKRKPIKITDPDVASILNKYAELDNVAEELDEDTLIKIGNYCKAGYDADVISREGWMANNEKWMKLAVQVIEVKNTPWNNAANVKYPLLTTAAMQFNARAYSAILNNNDIVKGRVIGSDLDAEKYKKSIRVGKYMSYQLIEEMEHWEDDMDKLLIILPIVGTAFKKTYYSPIKGANVSELVSPEYFVVNYYAKSIEDATRKTHLLYEYENSIREKINYGLYLDIDLDKVHREVIQNKTLDRSQNIVPPPIDPDAPICLAEMHCWYDIDGDGYKEPYIVTFLEKTGQVVRIAARYDVETIKFGGKNGNKVLCITPVEYFTGYIFVPDPNSGVYGLGYGALIGPINETINTSINQVVDSSSLATLNAGFLSRGIRIKEGNIKFSPGKWVTVNATGDDLRKGIFPLPVREASNTTFSMLELLIGSGEKLGSTVDSLMGENPGQNQPYATTAAVLEQGLMSFKSVFKRVHRSLKKEFKKLFRLNYLHLEDDKYFNVLDEQAQRTAKVLKSDFDSSTVDVLPASDPNVVSEAQRLAKAEALLQLVALGKINKTVATFRVLEAQNQHGIQELMQPEQEGMPPEIQLQMAELEHKKRFDWASLELDSIKVQYQAMRDRAASLKALAEAEAAEVGNQMNQYQAELDKIYDQEKLLQQRTQMIHKMLMDQNSAEAEAGKNEFERNQGAMAKQPSNS